MKLVSLFAGIGGFDLAADAVGWQTAVTCEINSFGRKVLSHHWPQAYHHDDIHTLTGKIIHEKIKERFGSVSDDIVLTGGFPCQDASIAKQDGKGKRGIEGARTGLFYEMLRVIQEVKPRYIVAENVANILKTNNGRDWYQILYQLGGMGYNAEWRVTRASEVGAPHNRARCFMVVYPRSVGLQKVKSFFAPLVEKASENRRNIARTTASVGISWPPEPAVCSLDDGISCQLDSISLSKFRNESIKAAGNAIVPQVAIQIFRAIIETEERLK